MAGWRSARNKLDNIGIKIVLWLASWQANSLIWWGKGLIPSAGKNMRLIFIHKLIKYYKLFFWGFIGGSQTSKTLSPSGPHFFCIIFGMKNYTILSLSYKYYSIVEVDFFKKYIFTNNRIKIQLQERQLQERGIRDLISSQFYAITNNFHIDCILKYILRWNFKILLKL